MMKRTLPGFWPTAFACCAAQAFAWTLRLPGQYAAMPALGTGVMLILLLRYGRGAWFGAALGACLWPLLSNVGWSMLLPLAALHLAQAVVVARFLPQFGQGGELRVHDGLRFLAVGPLVGAGVTSSLGVLVLYLFQAAGDAPLWAQWLLWWWSDAQAMLVALAVYFGLAYRRRDARAGVELGLLVVAALGVSMLVYFPPWPGLGDLQFLLFPLMVWAALRLRLFGVGLAGLITTLAAAVMLHLAQTPAVAAVPMVTLLVAVSITGLLLSLSNRESAAAARESRLAGQVFQNASEGILITDADARVVAVNPAFTRITGYPRSEAIGRVSRMFGSRGRQRVANREMLEKLAQESYWQGEMLDRRKNGEAYPAWLSISAVRDENGEISNYVGVFSDYTNRKEAEQRLHFLANHDALTKLYNRTAMHESLGQAVARASDEKRQLAVLFIDLDRFKAINDTLGHDVGDELLKVIAQRLKSSLKDSDLIARLGGDEFTVLLDNVHQVDDVAHIGERLLTELCRPIVIQGQELFVTCSIGISLYPGDGLQPAQLLKNADVAMYRAKELGKNNYQFFSPDMNARAFEHLVLENSLRYALERRELILHFQPQIDIVSGELEGVEALIRWEHPELGLIPPSSFIPLAEENGLIVPIGDWVLQEACRMLKLWQVAGYAIPRLAINLSARQFLREQLPQQVAATLASYDIPPQRLELEITESMIMQNPQRAVSVLGELRAMGVKLAIDDFGTGYSSLSNLKHFPLDTLKIDRSFIVGVPEDEDSAAIAEAIVAMAKKLRLKVVAEGVETIQQMLFMRRSGCHAVQGYLYAMPLDADALLRYLAREGYAAAGPVDASPA
ncbi:bifunctional diguanylate cyclase/phosphodiesterase [Chitiniphilus shinanonensis]|nr:EAL domain-containing protein [Chitiniphilus shinanonensis]